MDACYDNAYWNTFLATYPSNRGSVYDSTYDVRYFRILVRSQVQALLSDMCGWRMVAKRGYIGALTNATKTTLRVSRAVVPPITDALEATTWLSLRNHLVLLSALL